MLVFQKNFRRYELNVPLSTKSIPSSQIFGLVPVVIFSFSNIRYYAK